jgi:hypothetical protein
MRLQISCAALQVASTVLYASAVPAGSHGSSLARSRPEAITVRGNFCPSHRRRHRHHVAVSAARARSPSAPAEAPPLSAVGLEGLYRCCCRRRHRRRHRHRCCDAVASRRLCYCHCRRRCHYASVPLHHPSGPARAHGYLEIDRLQVSSFHPPRTPPPLPPQSRASPSSRPLRGLSEPGLFSRASGLAAIPPAPGLPPTMRQPQSCRAPQF